VNLWSSSTGAGRSKWDGVGETKGSDMDTKEIQDADSRLGSGTKSVMILSYAAMIRMLIFFLPLP
jgi:hypothetical protein